MSGRPITANLVLGVLGGHIGQASGIRGEDLARKVAGHEGRDLHVERLVRHFIEELRNEGAHICGTPATGYFLAANDEELNRSLLFLYSRAMASLRQISAMKRVSLPDLRGQLKLPT